MTIAAPVGLLPEFDDLLRGIPNRRGSAGKPLSTSESNRKLAFEVHPPMH